MRYVDVHTQDGLDAALTRAGVVPRCMGAGRFEAWGSSHVVAWGSSHVVAWGSSHVEAWGSSHVVASSYVAVTKQLGHTGRIRGGVVIRIPAINTAAEWCAFYGATVTRGTATLYKAVRDDYRSGHGFLYQPGTTPSAPDWDGGAVECGGGLHFCAHPLACLEFDARATRFVACPVRLKDIAIHKNAAYPQKVKAPRVAKPIWECDLYGKALTQQVSSHKKRVEG